MPDLGDFLNRFRPAGAPGAATRAGVPADRAADLEAELTPVLAMLASTSEWCAQVIEQARQEAGRIASGAREQAEQVAADGRVLARQARRAAADQALATARDAAAEVEREAAVRAGSKPEPAEEEVTALVLAAVRFVRSPQESQPGGAPR